MQNPKKFNRAMGAVIDRLRKTQGLSLHDVGSALGVSHQQAGKYISGENGLSAHYLPRLAQLLGVNVADLYRDAGALVDSPDPSPAQNDAFLAARYVQQIKNAGVRGIIVELARKARYQLAEAV